MLPGLSLLHEDTGRGLLTRGCVRGRSSHLPGRGGGAGKGLRPPGPAPASSLCFWFCAWSVHCVLITRRSHSHWWWPLSPPSPSLPPFSAHCPMMPTRAPLAWEGGRKAEAPLPHPGGERVGLGGWSFPGTGKGLAVPDRGPPAGTLPLPKPREHSPPFVGSAVPSEGLVLLSPSSPEPPRTPAQAVRPRVPVFPAAAGPRRQPHEALGVHAGAAAPPRGPAVQRRPGPRPRRPGRRAPPPPLPPPQGQEAEVPGEGAQPVRGHGWRCVRAPLVAVARLGVPEPLGTLSPPAPRDPPPAPTGGQRAPRPRRRTTHPAALPRALCWSGRSVSRLAGRDLRSPGPAPHSAGPGPPPAEGPAGGRRERRQERGRSQERRQPSSSSSEKQRFYSCDRFGGREPPHPRPSLSSHPTSPTAGQEPGPLRQVGRWAPGAPARPRPSAWRAAQGSSLFPASGGLAAGLPPHH